MHLLRDHQFLGQSVARPDLQSTAVAFSSCLHHQHALSCTHYAFAESAAKHQHATKLLTADMCLHKLVHEFCRYAGAWKNVKKYSVLVFGPLLPNLICSVEVSARHSNKACQATVYITALSHCKHCGTSSNDLPVRLIASVHPSVPRGSWE